MRGRQERKEVNTMTEERRMLLNEITEDLKHLDQKSLELMRTGVELLRCRDAMEKATKKAG